MVDIQIPLIKAEKKPQKEVKLDRNGFFVIEIRDDSIFVEYYSNVYKGKKFVSGKLEKVFTGSKADALCDTIAGHVIHLQPDHYLYLGRELQKAQMALQNNKRYIQGGC